MSHVGHKGRTGGCAYDHERAEDSEAAEVEAFLR